jgi:hypothetical protein
MKKLTRAQQAEITNAANLKYFQEHGFHEDNTAQSLYDMVDCIKDRMTSGRMKFSKINPTPATVEILDAMERALHELDALQQKYFPEPEEEAA